jgi:hypothetical protein
MPDGGDDQDELGQGDELEGEIADEHDETPGVANYLATGENYLAALEEQARQAGHSTGISGLRKAVKKTRDLVAEAERRAYERARAELRAEALSDQEREQLRAEYVEGLRGQDAARRNAMRLGVPDALLSNFEGLGPDFKDWERRAAELHAQNITWGDSDPLVAQVARERVAAWQQQAQAAQQNGQGVSLDPAGPVPESIREQVIKEATLAHQRAQAGGTPPGSSDLASEILAAARNPAALTEDGALALAERFNRELDSLSQARRQGQGW